MKFVKDFKIIDHPFIGNISLDFTLYNTDSIAKIVYIAGENGTCKSNIIDLLSKSLNEPGIKIHLGEKTIIETNIVENNNVVNRKYSFIGNTKFNDFIYSNNSLNVYKTVNSDVEINFKSRNINYITSQNIDQEFLTMKSDENLSTSINQLLVDIESLDNAEIIRRIELGENLNEAKKHTRINRFKKAFEMMFDNLQYDRIENIQNTKVVMFKKNGILVPLDALSSGEKQIIFRGSFLLRNLNTMDGGFVFIDEPEISMHPSWQMKIMDFYRGIFTDENGEQTNQIFVVTHSPFIIQNRKIDEKVIVLKRENNQILVEDKPEYYSINNKQVSIDAFNFANILPNSTVYVEGKTDEMYFNKAVQVYGYNNLPFTFKWVGYNDLNGKEKFSGIEGLNKTCEFLKSNNYNYKNVVLYDFDASKNDDNYNNVYVRSLSINNENNLVTKGIENLLILKNGKEDIVYDLIEKTNAYGGNFIDEQINKMETCENICNKPSEELKEIFANLKNEIEKLILLFKDNENETRD